MSFALLRIEAGWRRLPWMLLLAVLLGLAQGRVLATLAGMRVDAGGWGAWLLALDAMVLWGLLADPLGQGVRHREFPLVLPVSGRDLLRARVAARGVGVLLPFTVTVALVSLLAGQRELAAPLAWGWLRWAGATWLLLGILDVRRRGRLHPAVVAGGLLVAPAAGVVATVLRSPVLDGALLVAGLGLVAAVLRDVPEAPVLSVRRPRRSGVGAGGGTARVSPGRILLRSQLAAPRFFLALAGMALGAALLVWRFVPAFPWFWLPYLWLMTAGWCLRAAHEASWLDPLPVPRSRLARAVLLPPAAVVALGASIGFAVQGTGGAPLLHLEKRVVGEVPNARLAVRIVPPVDRLRVAGGGPPPAAGLPRPLFRFGGAVLEGPWDPPPGAAAPEVARALGEAIRAVHGIEVAPERLASLVRASRSGWPEWDREEMETFLSGLPVPDRARRAAAGLLCLLLLFWFAPCFLLLAPGARAANRRRAWFGRQRRAGALVAAVFFLPMALAFGLAPLDPVVQEWLLLAPQTLLLQVLPENGLAAWLVALAVLAGAWTWLERRFARWEA